jgi:hypothetical protein
MDEAADSVFTYFLKKIVNWRTKRYERQEPEVTLFAKA